MCIDLLRILFFMAGVTTICYSKVIINIRIYNYQNENDIKSDGWKCESFHWLNDHCDPMFSICVTATNRCDILNHSIEHWKNKKFVYNVLSRSVSLENIQKSFNIEVKIDDHDKVDGHDHIAMFNIPIQILQLNQIYGGMMIVKPSGLDVRLYASLLMRCADKYYGPNCDQFCQPKDFNYDCNLITGEKICRMDCGLYGNCVWENKSEEFICKCKKGWSGDQCQFSSFESCSTLNCNSTCSYSNSKKYCSCIIGQYVKMCEDPFTITSTTSTTKVTTTSATTRKATTTKATTTKASTTKSSTIITSKFANRQTSSISKSNLNTTKSVRTTSDIQFTEIIRDHEKTIDVNKDKMKIQQGEIIKESHFSATTIIIICLLLLLCICVISLSVVIRSWKKKEKTKINGFFSSFHTQRPLPPIIYRPNLYSETKSPIIFSNQNHTSNPTTEYDLCTAPSESHYETPLIKFDSEEPGIYEEPIINNNDSLTFETDIFKDDDNDSAQYEEPIIRF